MLPGQSFKETHNPLGYIGVETPELGGHVGQRGQAVGVEVLVPHLEHVVLYRPDHHEYEQPSQGQLRDGPLSVPGDLLS